MNYIPKAEELPKALDHVFYEIQQMTLMSGMASKESSLKNAILESCLLHVRNLLDFFECPATSKDDVLSAHYGYPASLVDIDDESRKRLNKDLAHLTYSRTQRSQADKEWRHDQVVLPVVARSRSFTEYLMKSWTTYGERSREDWQALLGLIITVLKAAAS